MEGNLLFPKSLIEQCIVSDEMMEEARKNGRKFIMTSSQGSVVGYRYNGSVYIEKVNVFYP